MITEHEISQLVSEARALRGRAFIVHGHAVGAAVLTTDREIFGGCNVESHLSGLGRCAEMVAIEHAITHGKKEFCALAVADEYITFPCGACLQFLLQFSRGNGAGVVVIAAHNNGTIQIKTLAELLPEGYQPRREI